MEDKPRGEEAVGHPPPEPKTASDAVPLTKRELVLRVAEAAGVRRSEARPVVEAVLTELGNALSRGETLKLRPLGRASVNRVRKGERAEILMVKLRRLNADIAASPETPPDDTDPLAEAAE